MVIYAEYLWKDIQETDVISCLWEDLVGWGDRDEREIFLLLWVYNLLFTILKSKELWKPSVFSTRLALNHVWLQNLTWSGLKRLISSLVPLVSTHSFCRNLGVFGYRVLLGNVTQYTLGVLTWPFWNMKNAEFQNTASLRLWIFISLLLLNFESGKCITYSEN